MAPGFLREALRWAGPWHRNLRKEETWIGATRKIRKREKTERKQVALSEVLPELNYQFWEGPRRLPTLISLPGQAFGLLCIPTTQSPEGYRLPKEALGRHVGHMQLELGVGHTGCGLGRGHMYADGGEESLSEAPVLGGSMGEQKIRAQGKGNVSCSRPIPSVLLRVRLTESVH